MEEHQRVGKKYDEAFSISNSIYHPFVHIGDKQKEEIFIKANFMNRLIKVDCCMPLTDDFISEFPIIVLTENVSQAYIMKFHKTFRYRPLIF